MDEKETCNRCHGTGLEPGLENSGGFYACNKCQGECKLDWIEMITGIKHKVWISR